MNSDSDLQIAGDILEVPHLLQPPRAHPSTVAEFAGLARALAADRAQWEPLVRYDAASRWYHRLRTGPGYEVWLLSWVPGQGTGPHGHGPSSGVLTVLDGVLTERSERGVRALGTGAQRVFGAGYAHEVVNDALAPAVSLHVYWPGLTEMPGVAGVTRATDRPGSREPRESQEPPVLPVAPVRPPSVRFVSGG